METKISRPTLIFLILVVVAVLSFSLTLLKKKSPTTTSPQTDFFVYSFNVDGMLEEAGSMQTSSSPYWWLNSGGLLKIQNNVGETIHGNLTEDDYWRKLYAKTNPQDTDQGFHPQNLFRLITKSVWEDVRAQAYFKIDRDQISQSINRNESNGLLLFNRYKDSNNLYYAGLRVDGTAVIKKKQNGIYYTLAQTKIFNGVYDREKIPSLLPKNIWIGLRTETITLPGGSAQISLYSDIGEKNEWKKILEVVDEKTNKNEPIESGSEGIRTDFMDVSFKNFQLENLRLRT